MNAVAMIVSAAEESGLLRHVAETIRFFDQNGSGDPFCSCVGIDELHSALVDAFDDHIALPGCVLEGFFGEGFVVYPATDAELAPYLPKAERGGVA